MSTDKHPTLYAVVPEGGNVYFRLNRGDAETIAGIFRVGAGGVGVPTEVVPYVPASALDDLRAEIERLRSVIDGATVSGPTTAKTCGQGEPPCKRVPGHAGDCMGLHGEALAADLADARAEVEALRKERDEARLSAERAAGERDTTREIHNTITQALTDARFEVAALTARAERAEADRDEWKAKAEAAEVEDFAVASIARDALSGGTSALDNAIRATVEARVTEIWDRVNKCRWYEIGSGTFDDPKRDAVDLDDVHAALAKGGK